MTSDFVALRVLVHVLEVPEPEYGLRLRLQMQRRTQTAIRHSSRIYKYVVRYTGNFNPILMLQVSPFTFLRVPSPIPASANASKHQEQIRGEIHGLEF